MLSAIVMRGELDTFQRMVSNRQINIETRAERDNLIIVAAQFGRFDMLQTFLRIFDFLDQNLHLAFQTAVQCDQIELVQNLLNKWSYHPFMDNDYRLFIWAAQEGREEVTKFLLPFVKDQISLDKAMVLAARHEHIDIVSLLLKFGGSCVAYNGYEALVSAVQKNDADIFSILLDYCTEDDSAIEDIFIWVAEKNCLRIFRLLFPLMMSKKNVLRLALVSATRNRCRGIVHLLLVYGQNLMDEDWEVFDELGLIGGTEELKLVLYHIQRSNEELRHQMFFRTIEKARLPLFRLFVTSQHYAEEILNKALIIAIERDRTQYLEFLLQHGAQVSFDNYRPLNLAIYTNKPHIVQIFCPLVTDTSVLGDALFLAVSRMRNVKTIKTLLSDRKIAKDLVQYRNHQSFSSALQQDNESMVVTLLPFISDQRYLVSALDYASQRGFETLKYLLERHFLILNNSQGG